MDVERSDECRALTAIVIDAKILKTRIFGGAQVALRLIFVAECLQVSTGHQELFSLQSHTVITQQVLKDFEIAGFVDTGILRYLLKIGEGTPLPLFMGNDGRVIGSRE